MGKMGLVGTDMIMNTWLQISKFELQITTFYIQSAFICLVNNAQG